MATYRFHTVAVSLHIEDTPIAYSPAFGPDVRVRVTYSQRGLRTPADATNFGPQFSTNWVKSITPPHIMHVANSTGARMDVLVPGVFPENPKKGAIISQMGDAWKIAFPDGREDYYEHLVDYSDEGQVVGGAKIDPIAYLTRVVDTQGNAVTLEYDPAYPKRLHRLIDATGLPTDFRYDYPGDPYLVTSIEDPYYRTATFAYAPAAGGVRLQSIRDPYGIVSSFAYSDTGEITSMTTPYGTTTFKPSPPYVHTGEALIRYLEATDPLGQTERLEYNIGAATGVPSGLPAPVPDSSVIAYSGSYNNYRNSFYWDKLAMKMGPGDYQKARVYHWLHLDSNQVDGTLESEVAPLENRIFYNYPGQSSPLWTPSNVALPSAIGRVVKDASGQNRTQATKFSYNARLNVTKTIDPVGRETTLDYAANGVDVVAVKQTTGSGITSTLSTFNYAPGTPPHRPSSVTDGAGRTTSYTYTPKGQVQTVTNPKGEVTSLAYGTDSASPAYGRVVSITGDVPGGSKSFTYDGYGRVRTATDSEGYSLTYDYDSLDRLRTVTHPDGSFEQLEYADHSLVATRDREGRWTRHMYNPLMQRVVTQDPMLRTVQFDWCRCGELKRFVDGNGNITQWDRDVIGRVTKKTHANGTIETYTYDSSGRLSTETDAMSRTKTYSYGVDDLLVKTDYSDAATPDVTYAYDPYFARVVSRADGAGTTTFSYHPYGASTLGAGQLAAVNGPLADDTIRHGYDELGRLKKLEIVTDATPAVATYSEEYTFDARSRVTGVQNNLGASSYAYVGQSSRPSGATYPNGMQVLYDYYPAAGDFLLKQIRNLTSEPTPNVISQFDYTYRQDRSIDRWTIDQRNGATTWAFDYDGARQLTRAERRDAGQALLESLYYGYDKAGNRVQVGNGTALPKNYDVNNLNQLLAERDHGRTTFAGVLDEAATVKVNGQAAKVTSTAGGAPFRFEAEVELNAGGNSVVVEARDGRGNASSKTYSVTTTGTSKGFEYDANGNLRFEKGADGGVSREYRWDQQNRLVRVTEGTHESVYDYDGESKRVRIRELVSSSETQNQTFIWAGGRIVQKRASNGSTVVRNYFREGFEQADAIGTPDYTYTRDHLESVREVVASDGTTIASRLSFDPWGKPTETGSVLSDFGFTGHYHDRPTGSVLAQYRGYDPNLGRWLNQDPSGLKGGVNLYAYVENDPANETDSTGLYPDANCMAQIRNGCREGSRGKMFSAAVYSDCVISAVAMETVVPGSICKETKIPKPIRCSKACLHLLPDPKGDLQCMTFQKCYSECMMRPE